MLARRFTIVCLLVALFGVFLSIVVDQNARSRQHALVMDEVHLGDPLTAAPGTIGRG